MYSHPKILFLVPLATFCCFNPYLPFKFLIFYHSMLLELACIIVAQNIYVSLVINTYGIKIIGFWKICGILAM